MNRPIPHSFLLSPSQRVAGIRGIGEKYGTNPVTGTGSMNVPIATSPGRAGYTPQLSIAYDSGAGNGPFGIGWNLSLPSITRKTDKGLPQYDDAAEFGCVHAHERRGSGAGTHYARRPVEQGGSTADNR